MIQEFINDCLCILNEAVPVDECLEYDDGSKEFVAYYCYNVADPDGMGGIDTRVDEAYRYSEEEILELMYGLCPGFYADEALEASCIIQSELPQEAWDSECERVLDKHLDDIVEAMAEAWRDSEADYQRQEQSDLQWEADHMY